MFRRETAQTVEQRPELPVSWIRQLFPGAYSLRAMTLLLGLTPRYQPRPKAVGCMPKLRGPHFDELAFRAWRWDGQAILLETVDVKSDGFAD
jgi:hypothetical protein